MLILAAALACAATPLASQAIPDSAAFIKAVKEFDGAKATALLNAAGSTVANSRDPATGGTALHIAVRERKLEWTEFLAGRGVDPRLTDKAGDTPLGLAARLGFNEGAKVLVARGAPVDGANKRGETPLIIAVQAQKLDMVKLLIGAGANPDKTDTSAGYSARDYARQDRRGAPYLKVMDEKRVAAPRKAATKARAPAQ